MTGIIPFRILAIFIIALTCCNVGCASDDASPSTQASSQSQERNTLELKPGQKWRYSFSENDAEFGFNKYEVTGIEYQAGISIYTLESTLHLEPNSACKPTDGSATLRIDNKGNPISYHSEASVGSG